MDVEETVNIVHLITSPWTPSSATCLSTPWGFLPTGLCCWRNPGNGFEIPLECFLVSASLQSIMKISAGKQMLVYIHLFFISIILTHNWIATVSGLNGFWVIFSFQYKSHFREDQKNTMLSIFTTNCRSSVASALPPLTGFLKRLKSGEEGD